MSELETVTITSSYSEKFARSMHGGAGPSGTDSEHWKDAFLRFGGHGSALRDGVAAVITKIANKIILWNQIRALMSGRLVALDKCPGVRPIGIGECLRRIMCKCMAEATKKSRRNLWISTTSLWCESRNRRSCTRSGGVV